MNMTAKGLTRETQYAGKIKTRRLVHGARQCSAQRLLCAPEYLARQVLQKRAQCHGDDLPCC